MTKCTDLEIIDLMVDLDDELVEKYNATLVLTGYGEYLETFKNYPESIQNLVLSQDTSRILNNVETQEADYFEISFD